MSATVGILEFGDVTLVKVTGEFDAQVADMFVASTMRGSGDVEVNLAEVTFLDSAGLSALAQAVAALDGEGRRVRVSCASPIVRQVIEICVMTELLGLDSEQPPRGDARMGRDMPSGCAARRVGP